MFNPQAYIPGLPPSKNEPLGRYLPPIPDGVASSWLATSLPLPISIKDQSLILDPFCTSPRLAIEAACAGYRVLVAANNPVARFLLEMAASPPKEAELRATLAELASTRKGDGRLEPHIRALYATTCNHCGAEVMAEAFLWDRESDTPFAKIYHCSNCGETGEFPTTLADLAHASQFSSSGLHRARALERVTALDDPDRHHVEEALTVYLPRALYALFNIINKLDSIILAPARRNQLLALCLTACDLANTLWAYPTERARPRQLLVPPRFRENNVWLALEQAIQLWTSDTEPVPLVHWPEKPPMEGGISLYEGRLKDLVASLPGTRIGAVLAPLPRPNQAYWTLSALWAGWLWGREAVGPFKSVLRRRRYDWAWHCIALHSALENLAPQLQPGTPVLGLIGENEPGFTLAAFIAAANSGYNLNSVALRFETGQAQIVWEREAPKQESTELSNREITDVIRRAAQEYLRDRGEPTGYLKIHTAGLAALVGSQGFPPPMTSPADLLSQVNTSMEEAFSFRGGFLRFGGSDKSLDTGQWWLRETGNSSTALTDRVEKEIVRLLIEKPGSTLAEIDRELCKLFRGLLTPNTELVLVCLESYAEQEPAESGHWRLRGQDSLESRRADLEEIHALLIQMAEQMGNSPRGEEPLVWYDNNGSICYVFYLITSAIIGETVFRSEYPPEKCLIAIPGGRANLVAYKIHRDPRLHHAVESGWRFVKFRQIRWLAETPVLIQETLDDHFSEDALTYDAPQLHLF